MISRVGFIHESLLNINDQLKQIGSSLLVKKRRNCSVFKALSQEFDIKEVFFNKDYEQYAKLGTIRFVSFEGEIFCFSFKDQVMF
jgi:deoxyribodipyrimidine photo-lyase